MPPDQAKGAAMKILVTGGAGFIGSHVTDAYLKAGHQVTVLDNLSTGSRENVSPRAELAELDVSSPEAADLVARGGFEAISHHAAQVSVPQSMKDPMSDLEANAKGTLNMITAAGKAGAKRFVFISSGGAVYGEQKDLPISEEAVPVPASPYAAHKYLGEMYLSQLSAGYGMDWVVLRYANVYGPRQVIHAEAGVAVIFCRALSEGATPTIYRYDDQPEGMVRDYVFVGDVVKANLSALTTGAGRVYNIGTGKPTTTLALWETLAKVAGKVAKCDFGPPRPGDVRESLLNTGRAAIELNWRPRVALAQGLDQTWQWHLENHKA